MLNFANERNNSLIYAGMGTGKTLFALSYLRQFPGLKLVICPKPAMIAWRDDLIQFLPYDSALVLDKGTSKKKADLISRFQDQDLIIVVNYETARLLTLGKYSWSAVVLDEGHRIGTYNSKQTLSLTRMLSRVPKKIIMTGTPYHDGYEKLYSMVRFFDGYQPNNTAAHPRSRMFGHRNDFLTRYCRTTEISRGIKIIYGYKNLGDLAAQIKPFTLQIKAEDVLDLPEVVERTYNVPLQGQAKKAYKQLEKESVIEYEDHFLQAPHLLTKIIRLQQLATSGLMVDQNKNEVVFDGLKERIATLKMLLEDLDEPVVVFTRFKRDVGIVASVTDEPLHYLTGDRDTHDHWRQGQGRILVANIGAGAEGVRLERARHMIFWSVGYSNKDFEQAKARIIRPGQQSKTVWLHYIVSDGTIDVDIYKTLTGKNEDKERLDKLLCII
jgi:SNF2 family DNA or RNA helicase